MSKIFVYYSLSGNGDRVAKLMEEYGYDVLKLIPKGKMPKSLFGRILKGGFLAGIGKCCKLKNDPEELKKINGYDNIVVGSPVWNSRLTPAVNSVLKIINRPFRMVCYSGSGKAKKVLKQLKKKDLKQLIVVTEPLKYERELDIMLEDVLR